VSSCLLTRIIPRCTVIETYDVFLHASPDLLSGKDSLPPTEYEGSWLRAMKSVQLLVRHLSFIPKEMQLCRPAEMWDY